MGVGGSRVGFWGMGVLLLLGGEELLWCGARCYRRPVVNISGFCLIPFLVNFFL